MKNTLVDLQNHLFEMIETLNDQDLKGDDLDREIKRSLAINELAKTAVTNGALMVKAADSLYGLPVSAELPLIPQSPSDTPAILSSDRKSLVNIPKGTK
jgi:molecular chaperone DnaK (HSP70)